MPRATRAKNLAHCINVKGKTHHVYMVKHYGLDPTSKIILSGIKMEQTVQYKKGVFQTDKRTKITRKVPKLEL